MIWTKHQIQEHLNKQKDDDEFIIYKLPLTPKQKSRAQECTYYRCFWLISKKIWMDLEEVKMNCLKALFWVTKSKFAWVVYENAIKSKTSQLNVDEARRLIESLIAFWKQLEIENMVTSREMIDLFNTN